MQQLTGLDGAFLGDRDTGRVRARRQHLCGRPVDRPGTAHAGEPERRGQLAAAPRAAVPSAAGAGAVRARPALLDRGPRLRPRVPRPRASRSRLPAVDAQLAEQAARLHARPLDRTRPLWEMYLISGLAGGRMAVYTKVHHAAIDGVSGADILGTMLDTSPKLHQVAYEEPPAGEPMPSQAGLLARSAVSMSPAPAARRTPLGRAAARRSCPGPEHVAPPHPDRRRRPAPAPGPLGDPGASGTARAARRPGTGRSPRTGAGPSATSR